MDSLFHGLPNGYRAKTCIRLNLFEMLRKKLIIRYGGVNSGGPIIFPIIISQLSNTMNRKVHRI